MIVLTGIPPIIVATCDAYAYKKAEMELIKQYRFVYQVFQDARQVLDRAETAAERRQILKSVGKACLR